MQEKKKLPVYQVTSEYADCLERSFAPVKPAVPGAASGGAADFTGASLAGAMSITPLSSSPLGSISEDTVHLSVWCDWGTDEEVFFRRLARAQRASQGKAEREEETDDPEDYEYQYVDLSKAEFCDDPASPAGGDDLPEGFIEGADSDMVELGDMLWKVAPAGKGTGESGRSYYKYRLMNGSVNLFFRRDRHETVANLWVEMGSIPLCLHGGVENLWARVKEVLESQGIHIIKDIVSRVDIYSDFDLFDVEECCRRFRENCKVTRARKIGQYAEEELNTALYMSGARHTGFSIGTDIKLRVYDKRYELKRDPLKWGVFADRYDGIPETLTRVEYQLRRNALKEFKTGDVERIEGVESYLAVREQLWRYLTEDWFRLTEEKVDKDNNHQSRAKNWTFWDVVQNAVARVEECIQRVRGKIMINPEHLFKMGMGCICKAPSPATETHAEKAEVIVDK